jgi:hypothetical protein
VAAPPAAAPLPHPAPSAMSYTERLLYTSSPRHPGIFAPGTPTATPDMVAADECDGDEAGALVAAACTGTDTDTDTGSTRDAPAVRSPRAAWALFVEESRRLWAIGAPIALNIICLYGTNSTTQIFAGHIGNLELSAVAVGLSVVSNFSFGFLLGMGSALETLCGQAFGAGQVSMLGVYMQRSWIILAASAALLTPLYVYAAPLLRLLGQDPAMAAAAGDFTIAIIPQMFALALNFPAQKFLQAQSKVGVLAWIGVAALLAHVALLALFVTALGWGVAGAALAYDLSSWLTSLAQLAYVVGWCRDGWTGLSRAAFTDLWAFVRLSLASAVMLCLEMWYMMLLVVLTGHLDDAEIAVDSIAIWFGPRPSSIRLSSVLNTLHSPLLIMDRFEQHEHQRVGGDAVHRPQRGHQVINISYSVSLVHPFIPERNGTERTMLTWLPRTMHACMQRPRVQRAGFGAAPGDQVRGGGGAGAVAGVGAAGHGARAGDAGPVPSHLHGRQAAAESRLQHRLPAGRDHGSQQHPARHLGRRRGRWLAGRRRLHQPRLLLRLRPPARLHLRLPLQIRGQGTDY